MERSFKKPQVLQQLRSHPPGMSQGHALCSTQSSIVSSWDLPKTLSTSRCVSQQHHAGAPASLCPACRLVWHGGVAWGHVGGLPVWDLHELPIAALLVGLLSSPRGGQALLAREINPTEHLVGIPLHGYLRSLSVYCPQGFWLLAQMCEMAPMRFSQGCSPAIPPTPS